MKRLFPVLLLVSMMACQQKEIIEQLPEETVTARGSVFNKISPTEIEGNSIRLIGEDWMLISAGNEESYNTMTASWGTLGELWSKPIATCYVRPERHTFNFMEKNEYYTLCFFDEEYKNALLYCGTHSGKDHVDTNKAVVAGLTPAFTENGTIYFKEAYLVLECKKLYADQFSPDKFTAEVELKNRSTGETSIYNQYPNMHKFYIGEIVNCWKR